MVDTREMLIDIIIQTPCVAVSSRTAAGHIADNLIANGVTVFPCKPGDPAWFVGTSNTNRLKAGVIETTVEKLVLKSGGIYMKLSCNAMYETSCRSIGKSVFFSKEEAEAALAKMVGDGK